MKQSSSQDIVPVFSSQLTLPEVHEDLSREPRQFANRPQSRQLRRQESRLRLDFDGEQLATAPQQLGTRNQLTANICEV